MPFELIIAGGTRRGRRFRFDRSEVTIGRAPGSDLLLVDEGVSRSHAHIRAEGPGHVLIDAGSSNGTTLNGTPVRGTAPLRPGDRIGVGPLVFEFGLRRRWSACSWSDLPAATVRVAQRARTRLRELPGWVWTCTVAGAGSCLLAAATVSSPRREQAPRAAEAASPAAHVPAEADSRDAPPDQGGLAGEARAARDAYDRGRRRLEERRIAPRNLYDAWRSFASARQLLAGRVGPPPLDELPGLIETAERELVLECKKLLFTARRFDRYGEEQKARAVYREMLLRFPGDDPGGCRALAQEETSLVADGDGSAR